MTTERPKSIKEHNTVKYALKFIGWMVVIGIAIGVANEYISLKQAGLK